MCLLRRRKIPLVMTIPGTFRNVCSGIENCAANVFMRSSASKPCTLGCCSNGGVCGLGPTFCGAGNCTSSCDQKSECDPGWGSAWSSKEKCPLNVCCSKFGFCGTTKDFCGDETVKKPSGSGATTNQRTIGEYDKSLSSLSDHMMSMFQN